MGDGRYEEYARCEGYDGVQGDKGVEGVEGADKTDVDAIVIWLKHHWE